MKLAIGIINNGIIKAQTAFALCRMIKHLTFDYQILFQEGLIIFQNRERVASKAIELGCTHLLFVDSDMFFEKDAILSLLERKKDIIGVGYNVRRLPVASTIRPIEKANGQGLVQCEGVGAGFMLINTDVFKNLSEPWFAWRTDDKGELTLGEDYYFCQKAKEAGYEIWADLNVPVKHIGDFLY